MRLYHGTSEAYLEAIKREGITPRKVRKDKSGNWKHSIVSCPSAVYLTNAYGVFYAQQAASKNGSGRLVVLEIDSSKLAPWLLTPDEDFLEQATREQPVTDANGGVLLPGTSMKKRTLWFRNRLKQFNHLWEKSLEHLGNCCYHGTVPSDAITRYALMPADSHLSFAVDPCMTLMNYLIMGSYYRELTKHVFGEELDTTATAIPGQLERLKQIPRDDVEIVAM
jgi:hypothetical protein